MRRNADTPIPSRPLVVYWLCLSGGFMQRLGSASARSTAMRIHGRGLQSGKPRSGQASLQCLLPDSLLVWSGRKALDIAPGLPDQCRHFSVLILSQPERHLALSLSTLPLPLPSGNTGAGCLSASLLFFRVCGGHVGHFLCAE